MVTKTNEQKCMEIITLLNEKALSTVLMFLEGVADQERHLKSTSPERVQEIEERIEKRETESMAEIKACQEYWNSKIADLQNWNDKKIEGVEIPDRYDISIKDVEVIYTGMKYSFDDMIYNTITALYSYGFKRGCNYIKAKKKAATRTAK